MEKTYYINIRYCIVCILMIGISIFFFYYNIIWCNTYYNYQKIWLNMGFICLIFMWILLTPLFIILITIFERYFIFKKGIVYIKIKNCIDYFKILFL